MEWGVSERGTSAQSSGAPIWSHGFRSRCSECVTTGVRVNILRFNRGNLKELIANQLGGFSSSPDDAVKDTLDFVRNLAQFKIPTALTTLGNLATDVLGGSGLTSSDPHVFAGALENLFLSPFASVLEEYGLPIALTTEFSPFWISGTQRPLTMLLNAFGPWCPRHPVCLPSS